jgi:hypothetical protein
LPTFEFRGSRPDSFGFSSFSDGGAVADVSSIPYRSRLFVHLVPNGDSSLFHMSKIPNMPVAILRTSPNVEQWRAPSGKPPISRVVCLGVLADPLMVFVG